MGWKKVAVSPRMLSIDVEREEKEDGYGKK